MNKQLRELNPEALFHLVVQRWDLVVALPLIAVLAAGLTYKIMPARYESSARLLIQDQQTVNPFMEDMVEEWSAQQRLPLVESIFRSHDTSEQVLRRLGRLDVAATPKEVNEAVDEFQRSFEVIGLGGEIVLLKVRAETPAEAHDGAVALVETFTERIQYPQRETLRASAVLFQEQLDQLRGGSDAPRVVHPPGVGEAQVMGEGNVRKALAEAEARLAGIEQKVERSEERLRLATPERNQLHKSLISARRRLSSLSRRYGSGHPELAAAKRRVERLEYAIERERQVEGGDPETRAQRVEASEAADHQALLLQLKEAGAEVEVLRNRLLAEELSKFAQGNQVWPVEAPVMPTLPEGPSIWFVIAGAFFAGLVLALFVVSVLAALDDSLRGERELAEAIGAPCLGRMPRGGT